MERLVNGAEKKVRLKCNCKNDFFLNQSKKFIKMPLISKIKERHKHETSGNIKTLK